MQIKDSAYEKLTTRERIIASMEAVARGDDEEKKRLVRTCPKKHYMQTDAAYSERMETLMDMAAIIEGDLRGHALCLYFLLMPEEEREENVFDTLMICTQKMANIITAWENVLKAEGIDPAVMQRVTSDLTHPIITNLQKFLPKPDPEGTKEYQSILEEILKRVK